MFANNRDLARAATPFLLVVAACAPLPTEPLASHADEEAQTESATEETTSVPVANDTILIDASRDGGVWWFPQTHDFDPQASHQGKALADRIRAAGYPVLELGRGDVVTAELLSRFDKVLRAGVFGGYDESELVAYEAFAERADARLMLVAHFLRDGNRDRLTERLGLVMQGFHSGTMTPVSSHPLAAGQGSLAYGPGSALGPGTTATTQPLALLGDGRVVMGLVTDRPAKVAFLGDLRVLQRVPEPLVTNLLAWFTS